MTLLVTPLVNYNLIDKEETSFRTSISMITDISCLDITYHIKAAEEKFRC